VEVSMRRGRREKVKLRGYGWQDAGGFTGMAGV
jgi:hypothetical protein